MKVAIAIAFAASCKARVHEFRAESNFICQLCKETLAEAKAGHKDEVKRVMDLFPKFLEMMTEATENHEVDYSNIEGTCENMNFCDAQSTLRLLEADAPIEWDDLIASIQEKGAKWQAKIHDIFEGLNRAEIQSMLGTIVDPDWTIDLPAKQSNINLTVPDTFDAREQWSDCDSVINHVRDQSNCGSCWAHGTTEALNDRLCIAYGITDLLSVADTTACCDFLACFSMGCNGGQVGSPWAWFDRTGVVTGGGFGDGEFCFDYTMEQCAHHVPSDTLPDCGDVEQVSPKCKSTCQTNKAIEYSDDKNFAKSSYGFHKVEHIKEDIYQYGTVTSAFTVYEDFLTYSGGVYEHTTGSALGGHAIKTIGWGTEDGVDYWLCVNSWNDTWGDKGTFKIKMGNCGINRQMHAGLV